MNLLEIKYLNLLFKSRWFPLIVQVLMLFVLTILIYGGISVTTDVPGFAKVLRNTNLANLVVWSYWWPLIIIAAIVLGRFWCMLCPVELVTFLVGRIGLRRKAPKLFKSGWIITIFYAFILIVAVHTWHIHRIPQRMAIYLLMLVVVAVVVSLIYQKRAFCSYVCPVGHLLGLYALVSPFEWRAKDLSICKTCKTKDCVAKKNHYQITGRSCTTNLYPATIIDNRDCLLCTQCLKACPYDNLRFSARWPFADFLRNVELRTAQIAFIVLVSGFVVYEILSEWPVSKQILMWLPDKLINALTITGSAANVVSAIVIFLIFPAILFLLVAALAKIVSHAPQAITARTFALLLLPTLAGAHLIKATLKMTSRIPYWQYAFSDPLGVATARKIIDKNIMLNHSIPNTLYPVISFTAAAVLLAALGATLLIFLRSAAVRGLNLGTRIILLIGVLAYWAIFGYTILKWRF